MRILLACGGSGGHLFPAIGLMPALRQRYDLLIVTGMSSLEKELLPGHLPMVRRIPSSRIPNGSVAGWARFFKDSARAFRQSLHILKKFSPDGVVGFGGYASVPMILAARFRRIPVLLHEQNIIPGKANRLLSRGCRGVAVSFPQALPLWNFHPRVKMTGNPGPLRFRNSGFGIWSLELKEAIPHFLPQPEADRFLACETDPPTADAVRIPHLEKGRFTILVMGGSQGAHPINLLMSQTMPQWLKRHPEQQDRIQLIHLTGEVDFERVKKAYQELPIPFYAASFHQEMNQLYSISHLVVGRAGATSLSELAYFGLPAILIPYPYASAHQVENARVFEKAEAAVVLLEKTLTAEMMADSLQELTSSDWKLRQMSQSCRQLSVPDTQERFLDLIEETLLK